MYALKSHLTFIFRLIRKHKAFSLINLLGLAASMAVCLLILLFIRDQQSYDQFHRYKDRIYRVTSDLPSNSLDFATSPAPLAPTLLKNYTGFEAAVRLRQTQENVIYGNDLFSQHGLYAAPSFFKVFSFELASGNPRAGLTDPYSAVLSWELAHRLFGDSDLLGQTVALGETGDFTVTGVLEPFEHKSHLDFDALFSFSTLKAQKDTRTSLQDWESHHTYYTYLMLEEGAAPSKVEAHLSDVSERFYRFAEGEDYTFGLQALTDISLGPIIGNEISTGTVPGFVVYFLGALCLVVMLAAGFNYTNLSIARSLKRAKEVGVRRVFGAHRWQIVFQFLGESVVFALLALLGACLLLLWLIPAFNSLHSVQLLDVALSFDFFQDPAVYGLFIGFALLVGLLSGLYPALRLSRYLPARVLKGPFSSRSSAQGFKGAILRKTFIIAQFGFSLVFIISALLLYRQFTFMLEADYGFDTNRLVSVELDGVSYSLFSNELQRYPDIGSISAASLIPGSSVWTSTLLQSDSTIAPIETNTYAVDEHFIETLGLALTAGGIITERFASGQAVVLNETAVQALDLRTPQAAVGQTVLLGRNQQPHRVAAVVKDFHARSLDHAIDPLVLHYDAEEFRYLLLRVAPEDMEEVAAAVENVWTQLHPADPLDLVFVEAMIEERYAPFRDLVQILGLAAAFAIFIACLGTLGMASYSTEVRTKEIGIRKVLGARVSGLTWLLSRDFLVLIGIAVVIAVPLAYLVNRMWLQSFAYRIDVGFWTFVAGISALLLPALLAVGSQTVKAALADPVENLRYE